MPARHPEVWALAQQVHKALPTNKTPNQNHGLHQALTRIAKSKSPLAPFAKTMLRQCQYVKNTFSAFSRFLLDNQLNLQKHEIRQACHSDSVIAHFIINTLEGINAQASGDHLIERIYLALIIHYHSYALLTENDTPNLQDWKASALNMATAAMLALPTFNALNCLEALHQFLLGASPDEQPGSLSLRLKRVVYVALAFDTGLWGDSETFLTVIQEIGLIGIKFSQSLSCISDMDLDNANTDTTTTPINVRSEFVNACIALQNRNLPMTADIADTQLKAGFGDAYEEMFTSLDLQHPIGTGSIAGVYRGILKCGEEVAVKIKKPGLNEQLTQTNDQAKKMISFITTILNECEYAQLRQTETLPQWLHQASLLKSTESVAHKFFSSLFMELDLNNEAEALQHSSSDTPTVFHHCANAIIMEYIKESISLTEYIALVKQVNSQPYSDLRSHKSTFNLSRVKRKKIAPHTIDFTERGQRHAAAMLIANLINQLFKDRQLSADQHPGNTLIAPTERGINRHVQIDLGLHSALDNSTLRVIRLMTFATLFKHHRLLARAFLEMSDRWQPLSKREKRQAVTALTHLLQQRDFFTLLGSSSDVALGIPMSWLSNNNFPTKEHYGLLFRSLIGSISNIAALQAGRSLTLEQFGHIMREVFFPHIKPVEALQKIQQQIWQLLTRFNRQ